jgi:hypothetical protein
MLASPGWASERKMKRLILVIDSNGACRRFVVIQTRGVA